MHELSVALDIVDLAERHARAEDAATVSVVGLRLGSLSGVDSEALRQAFAIARTGTLLASAELDIELVDTAYRCPSCLSEFAADGTWGIGTCPHCQMPTTELVRGLELELRYLEVD